MSIAHIENGTVAAEYEKDKAKCVELMKEMTANHSGTQWGQARSSNGCCERTNTKNISATQTTFESIFKEIP